MDNPSRSCLLRRSNHDDVNHDSDAVEAIFRERGWPRTEQAAPAETPAPA